MLAGAEGKDIWRAVWSQMCTAAVASLAGAQIDNRVVLDVSAEAIMLRDQSRPAMSPRTAYFYMATHVAEAAVSVLARSSPNGSPPGACVLLSLDRRAYDVTDYVEDHPGGIEYLMQHHGKDASAIFNSHSHSTFAHDLMRKKLLRFDGVAYVGRTGAPYFARGSISAMSRWSFSAEATDFVAQAANQYGATGLMASLLDWWLLPEGRSGGRIRNLWTVINWFFFFSALGGWLALYHAGNTVVPRTAAATIAASN